MSEEIKKEPLDEKEVKIVVGGKRWDGLYEAGDRFYCNVCHCEVVCDGTVGWCRNHIGHSMQFLGEN